MSSPEAGEPPYPERYDVPATTAHLVNGARSTGRRVVAASTTAVRAIETVAGPDGAVHPGAGWTEHVIGPDTGVSGYLWHEVGDVHLILP